MAVVALADYLPRMGASAAAPAIIDESPFVDRAAEAAAAARLEEQTASEARIAWISEQSEPLAARIGAAFDDLETSLADAMTRVLAPFLATVARRQAVDDLVATLRGLLRTSGHAAVRVSGPGDLLARIETQLGDLAAAVEFVPGEEVDVTVAAGRSIIATQIGAA